MVKELVRIVGISFILSGAFLYFYTTPKGDATLQTENVALQDQVSNLQTKLEQTEKELAHLQTLSSEDKREEDGATKPPAKEKVKDNSKKDDEKVTVTKDQESVAKITVTIESGTTSKDVASTLEKAKIIDDAKEFNDYLKAKKLTTSIQIGDHEIDSSMSIETISQIITTRPEE